MDDVSVDSEVRQEPGLGKADRTKSWQPGDPIWIESERTFLRSMTPSDVTDRVVGWFADPEVMMFLRNKGRDYSIEKLRELVSEFDNVSDFMLGIFDKELGRQIGWIVLRCNDGCGTSSRAIGDPDFRGRGLDFEVFEAFHEIFFRILNLRKAYGTAYSDNKRSIATILKYGHLIEGVRRQQKRRNQTWYDMVYVAILADAWKARKTDNPSAQVDDDFLRSWLPSSPVAHLVRSCSVDGRDTPTVARNTDLTATTGPSNTTDWRPKDPLRIETGQTVMCSMSQSDVTDQIVGWFNDPEVMANSEMRGDWTTSDLHDLVSDQNDKTKFMLCIFAKDSDELIGWAKVRGKRGVGNREVVIGNSRYWGQALEFETLDAIEWFMFTHLDLHKICATSDGDDKDAQITNETLGHTLEAIRRDHEWRDNRWHDIHYYGLLVDEWKALRANVDPG